MRISATPAAIVPGPVHWSLLFLFSSGCAGSSTPGDPETETLVVLGAAVTISAGEAREFSVLGVTEPIDWEIPAEAGTVEMAGNNAVLYTAGLDGAMEESYMVTARLRSNPSTRGSAMIHVADIDFGTNPDAVLLSSPASMMNRFWGHDVAVTDDAVYVAATLCGEYSRFSKRPLDGDGPVLFHELAQGSWPPTAQEQIVSIAVDSLGVVYLYVRVPVVGVDCSQSGSGGVYIGEVRRFVESEGSGSGFVETTRWDADAYLPRMCVDSNGDLCMLRRVADSSSADRLVRLTGTGDLVGIYGFEVDGVGQVVEDVEGLALSASGDIYISSGDFNNSVDPGVGRWVFDEDDLLYNRVSRFADVDADAAWGVDVDRKGRVFLAMQDRFAGAANEASIRVLNGALDEVGAYPSDYGQADLLLPKGVAVTPDGDVCYFDELYRNSNPAAARVGLARIDSSFSEPTLSINPPGLLVRAGFSKIFTLEGVSPDADRIEWSSSIGTTQALTTLGDAMRFTGGGVVGSGVLTAKALDLAGEVIDEAQVTISVTQFLTHGFSVPFGTIGQDGSGADYDIACGGGFTWIVFNDSLNPPQISRYASDTFGSAPREADFCPTGLLQSCGFDPFSPGANIAADGSFAYWIARDEYEDRYKLFRASHTANSDDATPFLLPVPYEFNPAIAGGGPVASGADATIHAIAERGGRSYLVRIDMQGSTVAIEEIVDFGTGSPPEHLAIHSLEDQLGSLRHTIVAAYRNGVIMEYALDGNPVSGFDSQVTDIGDISMGPDGLLYIAGRTGTGTAEQSTIHIFTIASGDDALEISSISDYQFTSHNNGLTEPRLIHLEALAVDDLGNIVAVDDVTWCDADPGDCYDGCGNGTLASILRISPDGTPIDSPSLSCPGPMFLHGPAGQDLSGR